MHIICKIHTLKSIGFDSGIRKVAKTVLGVVSELIFDSSLSEICTKASVNCVYFLSVEKTSTSS